MSGNLKILVHKSWHVWKRENREKVARDERNFKEECERKEDRERSLTQEKNLEILQESGSHQRLHNLDQSSLATNYTEGIIVEQPFRLFGDIEELDKKTRERNDQLQAKKDKEFQEKKRSGEAPWALGEGAAEKIGDHRFYSFTFQMDYHYQRIILIMNKQSHHRIGCTLLVCQAVSIDK